MQVGARGRVQTVRGDRGPAATTGCGKNGGYSSQHEGSPGPFILPFPVWFMRLCSPWMLPSARLTGDTVHGPGLRGHQATVISACYFPLVPRSLSDEPVLLLPKVGDPTDHWAQVSSAGLLRPTCAGVSVLEGAWVQPAPPRASFFSSASNVPL